MKGAVYADAGSLWDYKGRRPGPQTGEINGRASTGTPRLRRAVPGWYSTTAMSFVRSVGVGLIWASPFGPLRFDYAIPITKGQFDRVQEFRFGGGTSF